MANHCHNGLSVPSQGNSVSRRRLLAALPAAAALPAVAAVPALASAETPVMRLFREWLVVSEACDAAGREQPETPEGDAIYEALLKKLGDIESALVKAPCQTAQDFVAKVTAWTGYGVHTLPDEVENGALWAEARTLVGA